MARIHIVGNSIAYGLSDDSSDWSTRLKAEVNRRRNTGEKPRIVASNIAGPGNLLTHYLDSGLFESSVNCNRRGRQIGIFCVGMCEACVLYSQGETKSRRSLDDFSCDLGRLAIVVNGLNHEQPPESHLTTIFMGTTPLGDAVRYTPEGDRFEDNLVEMYNDAIRNHAEQQSATYIDLRTGFDTSTMLGADSIHPNDIGNGFIYERVMEAALEALDLEKNAVCA